MPTEHESESKTPSTRLYNCCSQQRNCIFMPWPSFEHQSAIINKNIDHLLRSWSWQHAIPLPLLLNLQQSKEDRIHQERKTKRSLAYHARHYISPTYRLIWSQRRHRLVSNCPPMLRQLVLLNSDMNWMRQAYSKSTIQSKASTVSRQSARSTPNTRLDTPLGTPRTRLKILPAASTTSLTQIHPELTKPSIFEVS